MADDDYEILPHQLLQDLKADVELLKKKLTAPDTKMSELILEIESLKDSIHEMSLIFQKALEQTKDEDVGAVIKTMQGQIQTVLAQNETIAKGMIAISDKVEDWMGKQSKITGSSLAMGNPFAPTPSPMPPVSIPSSGPMPAPFGQHSMGSPAFHGSRVAPGPFMEETPLSSDRGNLPPPPPTPGKKKSLGGMFR